jgi:hypothetical protein
VNTQNDLIHVKAFSSSGILDFHSLKIVLSASVLSDLVYSACSDGVIVRSKLEDPNDHRITTQSKRGLEQICIRNDAKIIATAGWDSR